MNENFFSSCILCNSENLTQLLSYSKHYLCRCNNCGLVFSQKIPTNEELYAYYQQYSYNENYYISPITLKRYREILKKFEPYRKNNRLLDVGCGNGIFLSVAKKMGWETYGVEFSESGTSYCKAKGLNVFQGTLSDHINHLPEFDIIVSIEVLEHINTPKTELSNFYQLLRKGGILYLTTPNYNGILRYILKDKYDIFAYPEHLAYYTPATLKRSLQKYGFKPLSIKTTGMSISRYKNSVKKSNRKKENPFTANSSDEILRNATENNSVMRGLKTIVNKFLIFTGLGLTISGVFIKPDA